MTTEKELKEIVDLLNQNSLNFYKLDYAYGKVKLVKGLVDSGVIYDVTGYVNRPTMAEILYAIQNYCSFEHRAEREQNKNLPEQLENTHALIMNSQYKEACDIFEQWFQHEIGNV